MRPLAVVMVTDPNPLTVTNLGQLAEWCDLVLTEGTSTFDGAPRTPLRGGWRELLGLDGHRLRVVTSELGTIASGRRQAVQRNSSIPVLVGEPDDRWTIHLDADEFLDAPAVLALLGEVEASDQPIRLGTTLRYGAIDRVAPRIHCCWFPDLPDLRATTRDRRAIGGGLLARAGALKGRLPHTIRFSTPLVDRRRTFGDHVTMSESPDRLLRKLVASRHEWHPRVLDEQHLTTMLGAGVHHAGWWIAEHDEPASWLAELGRASGMRIAGQPAPPAHLRALRAWAEARLDPAVPDAIVRAGDDYVARRPQDAVDVLGDLDEQLLARPIQHTGLLAGGDPGDPHG